ncbi:MAG: histone deacetylase [Spirochaetales bacterium]|nr:histone deacetylase [Spirochaetales bacterium]
MKTGLIYDDIFLKHDLPGHPEHAGRLKAVMSYLDEHSLAGKCERIIPRQAAEEELYTCHDRALVSLIKSSGDEGLVRIDPDTYMNEFSYEAAVKAAGGMIDLADAVMRGELTNGIVLSRPPGHHATASRSMGFCLFNTIALGARYCILTKKCKKAAIVDIDVHHGNGTQSIFYNDPSVLYISTHQYPHYPGTGRMNETGEGEGAGTTINIPFPAMTGDSGYSKVLEKIIIPALHRYQPEILFVSVGFDGHEKDPLSSIHLSLSGYNTLCRALIKAAEELCHQRIIFNLEGGYVPDVLGPGIGNIVRALIGDPTREDSFPAIMDRESHHTTDELIKRMKEMHNL